MLFALAAVITASLEIFPAKTLPGLHPEFRITLHNQSRSAVRVRSRVVLHVDDRVGGEGRLIDERVQNWSATPIESVQLRGHETHDYWFGPFSERLLRSYAKPADEALDLALPAEPGVRTVSTSSMTRSRRRPSRGATSCCFEKQRCSIS